MKARSDSTPRSAEAPRGGPTEVPALETVVMEWSFHYSGPREPEQNLRCVTCLAGAQKACPTHGETWNKECAHCMSAQGGPCQAHWGLEAALDAHAPHVPEAALEDYARAVKILLEEPPHPSRKNLSVTMRGNGPLAAAGNRELYIQILAR